MDPNYWSSMQASNRANVPVVDLNQPGLVPYSNVEVIPAASLELLMNQQRLAGVSGISFLPYPGAAYAAQVLDGSAVPTQTLLPGVAYNAVTTTAIQAQTQYSQPVTSSYRVVEQNTTVANVVPILNSVNSGQTTPLKQPLQSINLTDLLDYSFLMEHGMGEAAGTMDLRNPAVLANMLQSLNAASMPSSDDRSTQSSQSVDIRQFPAAKQPAHTQQQLLRETVNVPQQHVPLSNQQLPVSQLYAGYGASTVASTAAVLQSSQQKDTMPGTGLVWPWADQLLLADKSQNETALGLNPLSVPTPVTSSSLPVSYEAVSPASAVTDNMSYSLLDNLQLAGDAAGNYQLSSFLGPTVDSSTLFTAVPYSLALSSQQSRPDVWSAAAVTQPSYSASSGSRLQTGLGVNDQSSVMGMTPIEPAVSRQSTVELDKLQKQKSNLGVVMPMIHSSLSERNSVISEASSVSCRTTSASAAAEPQSQYLANSQLSTDKSAGQGTDSAAGGIVLTNITGNVYVNQYTMMPGGTQPLDNALLHADLAAGSGTYDSMVDETAYSYAAPSVAVVLNSTDDDLSSFAAEPLTADSSVVEQPRQPKSSSRKSAPPESSFFGADAAPILAAKPSNKFESSFLQFVCGHKAETLSSVLNSPIKTRPALPKYIPEPPRRPKPVEVSVAIDSEDKTEELGEPSGSVLAEDRTTPSTSESTISVSNPNTVSTDTANVSLPATTTEWPSVTKLPAKFSHKWKNRTSLSSMDVTHSSTTPLTAYAAPKAIEVASSKLLSSSADVTTSKVTSLSSSSAGKTKSNSTKWTVSKKSKYSSSSQSKGLPVLVLKAVPVTNTRSSSSTSSTKTSS